jgi:NTP pyrophosphatase (non-canonical NTP hydrolase)
MNDQQRVAAFVEDHGLETPPAYRLLDLVSEVGELGKEVTESTDYGAAPGAVDIDRDELGDTLFALLALAEELDVDASAALEQSLEKYERRIDKRGSAGSGN